MHHPHDIDQGSCPPARVSRLVAVCVAVVLALGSAADAQDDPGRFEVRSASAGLDSDADVYFLNARLELRLSTESREALESGLPINIRVEVEIIHLRRFLLDRETAALTQLYRLQYHALLERYTVRNVNSGNLDTFATLFAALNFLGRVDGLPLIDRALLDPDRRYDIRLRVLLDMAQLPGPLRLLAFWRRDWSLGSEWYRWSL
ncbi:DUF4390 domain-containing protein [Candidatus Rariloculus sp.]|uniref:DUF4390 domain-containing protein n=1 Tax=Candidatus Rariloculus sp. TaxID=3101265 RepID=UPI003D0C5F3B